MYAVAVLLSSMVGVLPDRPATMQVELVEVNHCYNRDTGERRFIQVIYWDRQDTACLHVRTWHMADKLHAIHADPGKARYLIVRRVDHPGKLQFIRAKGYRVTHTFQDPEEIDRRSFPLEARQPLGN